MPAPIPVLCLAVGSRPPGQLVLAAGTTRGPCSGCGTDVYMTPVTVGMIRRGEVRAVCPACLPAGPHTLVTTDEQRREIERHFETEGHN